MVQKLNKVYLNKTLKVCRLHNQQKKTITEGFICTLGQNWDFAQCSLIRK